MPDKQLIVITGPTAVGKTALCLSLAKCLNTAIVSADARQVYREMSIGTAKPTEEECKSIKHYLVGHQSIHGFYNAATYEQEALEAISTVFKSSNYCILSGGSGLYIQAVCFGLDHMPKINFEIRDQLQEKLKNNGLDSLIKRLKDVDPTYYYQVDLKNTRRVIRALEVYEASQQPYSSFRKNKVEKRPFNIKLIVLNRPRVELYARINQRVDEMVNQGLVEEAKRLFPYRHYMALQTVGYKELFNFFTNKYTQDEAIDRIKQNTRNYAKRQLTWWRKFPQAKWMMPDEWDTITKFLS